MKHVKVYRGIHTCMQIRMMCIQLGAASIGFLATEFDLWKKTATKSV